MLFVDFSGAVRFFVAGVEQSERRGVRSVGVPKRLSGFKQFRVLFQNLTPDSQTLLKNLLANRLTVVGKHLLSFLLHVLKTSWHLSGHFFRNVYKPRNN